MLFTVLTERPLGTGFAILPLVAVLTWLTILTLIAILPGFAVLPLVAVLPRFAVLPLIVAFGSIAVIAASLTVLALGRIVLAFAVETAPLRVGLGAGAAALRLRLGGRRLNRLGKPLARQGKAIGHHEVVVIALVGIQFTGLALVAGLGLLLGLLGGRDDAEIMLGVLQVAFGGNGIAGRLGVTGELQIFFTDVLGGASDFDVGTIRLVGPRQRVGASALSTVVAVVIVVIPAPHTLVLARSHRVPLKHIRTHILRNNPRCCVLLK
ncbi:hypothetical protein P7D22_12970 [Lichenihabitans sp. Uapishka_5]|nr:hypothetical protein [Lichenihabitans sp. Uapishka_5]MDX7952085.1 hypothetical protein [Lichenihabitans sp. Uapishka_5]